jgi:2-isopropylmalate synthase
MIQREDKLQIYDTTLRDGAQMEGVSFSVEDKLRICKKLEELGIHYIEGGWPASSPKEREFFKRAKGLLKSAKLVAFGSTRRKDKRVEEDANVTSLLDCGVDVVTIFGKSWDLHVKEALQVTEEENIAMIKETISYLKEKGLSVIYDAEHFFDAYKSNPDYALKTLLAAEEARADVLVLCDTNGGTLPKEVEQIIERVKRCVKAPLGIHAHNDAEMAVANTIVAVQLGCTHVQGTINGYGERCGNANLCSILPTLVLKLGIECIEPERLKRLTEVSRFVAEVANLPQPPNQPYVGVSSFTHKGGVHISAIAKRPKTYEHIPPESVGNKRKVLVSELAGKAAIMMKGREYGIAQKLLEERLPEVLSVLKHMESEGYQFEAADASFEILLKKTLGIYKKFFELKGFRVIVERTKEGLISEATVKVEVDGVKEYTVAEGDGPVHALDNALRKALLRFYPALAGAHLTDYKVRVLDAAEGTAAKVRVLVQTQLKDQIIETVGVSENIIEASYQALSDAIQYILLKECK